MHVPEEAAGRPRRVGRSAQATNAAKSTAKSTMAKLGAPPAVGMPKPPQIFTSIIAGIIASIIEDILEEGKKPIETPAGDEHLEPTNSEVPVVATEDVEEGHPEISSNADVPEEIVSPEQVIMSKTHEYQTYTKPSHHCFFEFSLMFSFGMLFIMASEMLTSTFAWTFVLIDCNVRRFVWTSFETCTKLMRHYMAG